MTESKPKRGRRLASDRRREPAEAHFRKLGGRRSAAGPEAAGTDTEQYPQGDPIG